MSSSQRYHESSPSLDPHLLHQILSGAVRAERFLQLATVIRLPRQELEQEKFALYFHALFRESAKFYCIKAIQAL